MRWRQRDHRLQADLVDGITVLPLLSAGSSEGRELARAMRHLGYWDFGLGSRNFQETPAIFERFSGMDSPHPSARAETGTSGFAVVLHLHYPELWPEFEARLLGIRLPFKLIVTVTDTNPVLKERIEEVFPSAEVIHVENRGRDVGPFVHLLSEGRLDDHAFVCKVHGKRSGISGARALFGDIWRKATVFDLLGSTKQVDEILQRFAAAPEVGMIGSGRFRMPNELPSGRAAWGKNQESTLNLASRIGILPEDFYLEFFAGTMFWVRRTALEPMRRLSLRLKDFPEEDGATDGQIHHALERIFGVAVLDVGMTLENAPIRFEPRPWP